jgi:hypothetical protein
MTERFIPSTALPELVEGPSFFSRRRAGPQEKQAFDKLRQGGVGEDGQ